MILVVYRKSDNKICGNSGTGPVLDRDHEIANAVFNFGGHPEDYEAIKVEHLPKEFRIENDQIVELPSDPSVPISKSAIEFRLEALESAVKTLKPGWAPLA